MAEPTADMRAFLTELADLLEKHGAEFSADIDAWGDLRGIEFVLLSRYTEGYTQKLRDHCSVRLGSDLDAYTIRMRLPKAVAA